MNKSELFILGVVFGAVLGFVAILPAYFVLRRTLQRTQRLYIGARQELRSIREQLASADDDWK